MSAIRFSVPISLIAAEVVAAAISTALLVSRGAAFPAGASAFAVRPEELRGSLACCCFSNSDQFSTGATAGCFCAVVAGCAVVGAVNLSGEMGPLTFRLKAPLLLADGALSLIKTVCL